jgi:Protein of unknown function (DUF3501)
MSTALPTGKLAVADIDDIRAYERVRDRFRAEMIALRDRRRVSVGTMVSVAFENRETVRFQIQEMARVEGITTDQGIQEELHAYNPLIPEPGQLCATLFIELTSDEAVREWLPKLVGIETSVVLRLPNGDEVHSFAESQHAAQLTRADVTAAVHYIRFELTPVQCDAFRDGVVLAIEHPRYAERTELRTTTIRELANDLRGS